jgi:hypothetical protein
MPATGGRLLQKQPRQGASRSLTRLPPMGVNPGGIAADSARMRPIRSVVALLALGVAVLVSPASTAAATSPAKYRSTLNAMCRKNTVRLHTIEAQLASARTAGDAQAYTLALGKYFALGLREDATIETTPVPSALRARMAPVIKLLRQADRYVHGALTAAGQGNATLLETDVLKLQALSGRADRNLDAAGLRDCGSNQK